jgi:hypothetical protein
VVAAVLAGGIGTAVATHPWWARGLIERRLVEGLARRCDAPVTLRRLELGFGELSIAGLRIGEGDAVVVLDEVHVELDGGALWRGVVDVEQVEVQGGTIEGERGGLEALARRTAGDPAVEGSAAGERGPLRATPTRLSLEGVRVIVREGDRGARAEARLSATGRPRDGAVDIVLEEVVVDHPSGRQARARRVAASLTRGAEGGGEFPLVVSLEGGAAALGPRVALAEVEGTVEVSDRDASRLALDLSGGFSGESEQAGARDLWSLAGSVERDMSAGHVTLSMERFELGRAPELLAKLPLEDSERATVGGHVEVSFGDGKARARGDVELVGLNVRHDLLARELVRDVGFSLQFEGELWPDTGRLVLDRATIRRGGVTARVEGEVVHGDAPGRRKYKGRILVPPVPCQEVLDAIPVDLVPTLQGFELEGDFDLDVRVDVDYADLDALVLDGHVGLWGCKVVAAPARVSAARLAGEFVHTATLRDDSIRTVRLAPGSGTFAPLERISPNMISAVLTTEDAGFWRHRGFLPSQFAEALRRNLRAGEVQLGASTITMQMVKNVALTHERTLSRKLQEMFLTFYVERTLGKRRIMEIYLNVIEFGPGIYGVTRAARHYFGKEPAGLTSLEAAFLAVMLPSPVRRHAAYCQDSLGPRMNTKVRRIHDLMLSRGHIDPAEHALWHDAPLLFDAAERGDPEACMAEIARLLRAGADGGGRGGAAPELEEEWPSLEAVPLPDVGDPPGIEELDPADAVIDREPAMDRALDGEPR